MVKLNERIYSWDKTRNEIVMEVSDVYDAEHKVPRILTLEGVRETVEFTFVRHEYNPEGGLDAEVIALHYRGMRGDGTVINLVLIND